MRLRSLTFIFSFVFCIALISCGNKEFNEPLTEGTPQDSDWTDSIYGKLNARQQYYQHLIIEIPRYYQLNTDSLLGWISENQPGGIKFQKWHPDTIQIVKNALDTLPIIRPFIYCNYFEFLDLPQYPYWESNTLNRKLEFTKIFQKSGMNLLDMEFTITKSPSTIQWLDTIKNAQSVYVISDHFSDENLSEDFGNFMSAIQRYDYPVNVTVSTIDTAKFENFRTLTGYNGLFILNAPTKNINNLLAGGADLIIKHIESGDVFSTWSNSSEEFEKSTKRILNIKSRLNKKKRVQHLEAEWQYTRLNLVHNSVSLISDKSKMIPFDGRFYVYSGETTKLSGKIRKEVGVRFQRSDLSKESVERIADKKGDKVLILHDSVDVAALNYINKLDKNDNVLVCFQSTDQYEQIKKTPNLLFIPKVLAESNNLLFQQLSSRLDLNGDFIYKDSAHTGIRHKKTLLARTIPEYSGLDSDTLGRINWAINDAIRGRAFPGCQVLLAKNGCIIYDKQFGYHSYKRQKLVTDESIYDLASITKVVATTLMGMKLWELGKYQLNDSLEDYLPDTLKDYIPYPSTIRNITFQELFIHKSGLPPGFPLIRYLDYKTEDIGAFDKYYCDRSDSTYCIEVAEGFYMDREYKDSMWLKLNQMWLDPAKPYKYSDVNMNTLFYMFKRIIDMDPKFFGFKESKKRLEGRNLYVEYLYKTFYKPLGMNRTRFKPLEKFARQSIVPTEDETFWRNQLLQGHVHDPNAALMGGIAGNAGMFSTTNDLVKLCQMWLNKGVYGGKRYLNTATVEKFTSVAEDSHRGLGFNKRSISTTGFGMADSCSIATYGHTGFTGTCFWVDPEEDLIYIFLSNRVHPKVNNRIYQYGIRKRVHNAAYDARLIF
ncbi:MAG: serine hydrolase [Crocinitomicaceae bacterium]|nr:serine hydrolase [Crocinitomicaceae bacterium]